MRRLLALALAITSVSPVLAQSALSSSTSVDPGRGTTTTEPGVSPPASKTVVPEIPADKKPNMEPVKPSETSGSGASSGTSGDGSPQDSLPPQQQK